MKSTKSRAILFANANAYATRFVAGKLYDPNSEAYSKNAFIDELKSKYGIKSRIRLFYWSMVYKGLVDHYMIYIIKSMGENPINFIK